MDDLEVYTDGAARGNPGPAAIGYAMFDSRGSLVDKGSRTIGHHTNSEAEYEALLWAMEKASTFTSGSVSFFSDSEFMVRQVNGQYRAREERMIAYLARVNHEKGRFRLFEITHVPRANPRIELVDGMVNDALDRE